MSNLIKLTEAQLRRELPCAEGWKFAQARHFDFRQIYAECPRGTWMIWLVRRLAPYCFPSRTFIQVAQGCAERAQEFYEAGSQLAHERYALEPDPLVQKATAAGLTASRAWLAQPTVETFAQVRQHYKELSGGSYGGPGTAYVVAVEMLLHQICATESFSSAYYQYFAEQAMECACDTSVLMQLTGTIAGDQEHYLELTQKENLWQADLVRNLMPNPFEPGTH